MARIRDSAPRTRPMVRWVLAMALLVITVAWAQEPITLRFVRLNSQAHNAYLDPIVTAFQAENPDIHIEAMESSGDGYEGLAQTALLGLAAGNPPDIVQVGFTFLRTLVSSGGPIPLDDFMANDPTFDPSAVVPAMLDLGRLDGTSYIVPIGVSTPVMYYNADLFREVGLDPDKPPTSWADARAAATKLHDAGYQGILWGWSITGNWIFQTMLENAGGALAKQGPSGYEVTFDQKPGLDVVSYLRGLTSDGLMPVTEDLVQTFASGRLGMLVDSSFQRVNTPSITDAEVRLAPIPTPDGSPPLVVAGGNGVMMFARDPARQAAAWKFLRFLMGPTASRIVAENTGYTPANTSTIDALRKENANDPNYQVVLDQVGHVVPWHAWPGKNGPRIVQTIKDMLQAEMLERVEPQQGLDQAAAEVRSLLGE